MNDSRNNIVVLLSANKLVSNDNSISPAELLAGLPATIRQSVVTVKLKYDVTDLDSIVDYHLDLDDCKVRQSLKRISDQLCSSSSRRITVIYNNYAYLIDLAWLAAAKARPSCPAPVKVSKLATLMMPTTLTADSH